MSFEHVFIGLPVQRLSHSATMANCAKIVLSLYNCYCIVAILILYFYSYHYGIQRLFISCKYWNMLTCRLEQYTEVQVFLYGVTMLIRYHGNTLPL